MTGSVYKHSEIFFIPEAVDSKYIKNYDIFIKNIEGNRTVKNSYRPVTYIFLCNTLVLKVLNRALWSS
jgi:hypothetical protein